MLNRFLASRVKDAKKGSAGYRTLQTTSAKRQTAPPPPLLPHPLPSFPTVSTLSTLRAPQQNTRNTATATPLTADYNDSESERRFTKPNTNFIDTGTRLCRLTG